MLGFAVNEQGVAFGQLDPWVVWGVRSAVSEVGYSQTLILSSSVATNLPILSL